MTPRALPQHPDLTAWCQRHLIDPSLVTAAGFDVRAAPTREHPHQVRVDYVKLLLDERGNITGRDSRTLLTCDPPGGWLSPTPEQTAAEQTVARFEQLVARSRVFAAVSVTLEEVQRILKGDDEPSGYVWTLPPGAQPVEPPLVTTWCDECEGPSDVVDEFDDQVGVEERARDVHVRVLDCGHDIATAIRRPVPGRCPHVDGDDCDCAPVIP